MTSAVISSYCSLFSALDTAGCWFAPRTQESEPASGLGCDRDSSLHVRVNVAVIGERSRSGEGELEAFVWSDIARGTKGSRHITGHCMGSIRAIQPYHLRSHFDCERCRL